MDLNYTSGQVQWAFDTLDPDTGELPLDPLAGFLPPNDDSGRGEGYVSFSIYPRADATHGTIITNSATIVFDTNEPIVTNEVMNTIRTASSLYLPLILKGSLLPTILFDETHNEGSTLSWERAQQLNPDHPEWHYFGEFEAQVKETYSLRRYVSGNLADQTLYGYDILILATPNDSLSEIEIGNVVHFVQNGGGLLVLGDAWLNEDINNLINHFAISFAATPIASPQHDWDAQSFYVTSFTPHSITQGLENWHMNWGGSLQVSDPALSLSTTSPDAWGDENGNGQLDSGETTGTFTLMAAAPINQGRVVVLADNAFHEDMFSEFNAPLMMNMLNWLLQGTR